MLRITILLTVGLFASSAYAQELPSELDRLKEQRDRKIAEIDKIYLGELDVLLQKYTRSGDLDSANRVAAIIDSLQRTPTAQLPETDEELREFLEGTKWDFGNGKVITLHRDGTIRESWGVLKPEWEVKGMSVFIGADSTKIHFLNNFTEASKIDKRGVREQGKIVD